MNAAVTVADSRAIPSPRTRVISTISSWSNPASMNSLVERAASMSSSENTLSSGSACGSPSRRRDSDHDADRQSGLLLDLVGRVDAAEDPVELQQREAVLGDRAGAAGRR